MYRVRHIESLELAELQPYRTMRRQHEHRQQGIFVAEGEKVVRRLLESRFTVDSVLLPPKWLTELEPLLRARPEEIEVFVAEKRMLEGLTGFSMYQGLLAAGRVPPPLTLLEAITGSRKPALLVAAEGLSSAENVGALVRNCAAFRVDALLIGETSSSPYLRRAVRSSMGAIFELPIVECGSLVESLRDLRARGIRCVAAHPHADNGCLPEADFTGNCCVVFGSEGYGISEAALRTCDESVAIPMPNRVDSLNVSSAAAAFLYEANRQRGHMVLPRPA